MPLYFFMIHVLIPNVISLRVSLYIEATDQPNAQLQATNLTAAFSAQFQILFPPSAPVLLIPTLNGPSFNTFIDELKLQAPVSINLPVNSAFALHQHLPHIAPLTTLEARSLIPGSHSMVYSL